MTIELKMPALSPTMEKGTLAKWLVGIGDFVKPGDLIAEIETDKATMEFEAADAGRLTAILISEGTDDVAVGTVIATLISQDPEAEPVRQDLEMTLVESDAPAATVAGPEPEASAAPIAAPRARPSDKIKVSPLAARIAKVRGIELDRLSGSGPNGRIVKADLGLQPVLAVTVSDMPAPPPTAMAAVPDVPHKTAKLSSMRRTIARRLTESKQQVPHIYLTIDVALDTMIRLRGELNASLESRSVTLSVNDMLIKALGLALVEVPSCNVMLAGENLVTFRRADISVAVSIPAGLITPIIVDANSKSLSSIATEMKDLASRARDGKLKPQEYQGGTASLSNMGMFGVKQFEAVINPPQAMILAVGAGEKRPHVVQDKLRVATVMSVTGSFDHRVIDGADGANLLAAFKRLIENPLSLVS